MASRASIVCYYDVVSPYSFMGVKLLRRFRTNWSGVDITFRPILLGAVMNSNKGVPLFEIPAKKSHMIADLDRISTVTGIPFKFPQQFPVLTVLPMRLLSAVQLHEPAEKYEQCIEQVFDEFFLHGKNISKPDILHTALLPLFNNDAAKVQSYLELANQPDIKNIFKSYTEEAIAKGAFGAPTFAVKRNKDAEEHIFFGSDRLEMIAAFLGQPYPGLVSLNKEGASKL